MEGKNNFDSTRLAEFERKGRKYEFDSFSQLRSYLKLQD